MRKTQILIQSWIFLLLVNIPFAQADDALYFAPPKAELLTKIGQHNSGEVNHIFQDSHGYIWFATTNGIIKFDGQQSKRYANDENNPHSLSLNWIGDITEDQYGYLWLTTQTNRLIKFDPRSEKAIDVNLPQLKPNHRGVIALYNQVIDAQDRLWLGTGSGLHIVDIKTHQSLPLPSALEPMLKKELGRIETTLDGAMIFAFLYDGFYWYQNNKLAYYNNANTQGALASDIVQAAYTDSKNRIWIGTQVGLHQFIPKAKSNQNKVKRHLSNDQLDDGHREYEIASITEDKNGHLWLGTYTAIHTFNPQTQQFINISKSPAQNNQYPKTQVLNSMTDASGSVWLSSRAGAIVIKSNSLNYQYITNKSADLLITDIEKPDNNQLEFVADRKLYKVDLIKGQALPHIEAPPQLYRVDQSAQGQYWYSTVGTGLHHQVGENGISAPLIPELQDTSDQVRGAYDVMVQNPNIIWALALPSNTSGIGSLIRYQVDNNSYQSYWPGRTFVDLIQWNNKIIAAGHQTGIYTIDKTTEQQQLWKDLYPDSPISVTHLHAGSDGQLWMATPNKGLVSFNPKNQTFGYFDTSDGLIDNNLMVIIEDQDGYLWLGSTIGFSRFDPKTATAVNFTNEDGLLFSQIRRRAGILSEDGKVIFGTNQGLVIFDPKHLAKQPKAPKVVFNDFKLFNQTVALSTKEQPTPLTQPIAQTKQLKLSHRDYVFSLHFSALEFLRPDKIQFAYRMIGLDEKWLYTDASNRQASYTTLSPGDYIFEVKASDTQGQFKAEAPISQIEITIEPPFWRTWTAYILYVLITITIIGTYIKVRTTRLIKQAQELEQQVQKRTKALQQSKEALAQKTQTVSELLEQKRKMFSSVSHEFRTPLTLILTPIEQLLNTQAAQPFAEQLKLVKRNSKRLLRMVDQLLEFAKLEQNHQQQTAQNLETVNIKDTFDMLCASFEPLFDSKNIKLTKNIQGPERAEGLIAGLVRVLPDSLDKILINLLSNAAKYTKSGGQVDFNVQVEQNSVTFKITDTGIGISEQDQTHIFERFNRATNHQGEAIPGAGIGLALVKELVDANQGTLKLQSQLEKGSCFSVTLPLAKAAQTATNSKQNQQPIQLELETITDQTSQIEDKIQEKAQQQTLDNNQTSILVIDDNSDMRALLQNALSDEYHILTASNGQQGIDIATRELPDLIISDIMMPLVDGYQLSQTLKNDSLTCHIPIILLSAKGSLASRIKGLETQVDDYLAKPFNVTELKLRVNNILTIRELIRKRNSQLFEQQLEQIKQAAQQQIAAEQTKVNTPADEQADKKVQPKENQLHLANLSKADQAFCEKVYQQLEKQYSNTSLTLTSLASDLCLSQRQFQRKLKAIFDSGFPELVSNFRLQKAIKLLENGHRVSNVYYDVGFSSHSYFSACFKAKYGRTPKQYQSEITG